jgi:hypothetical protein
VSGRATGKQDEAMDATKTKPYDIDKKLVYDAYKAVKTNAGAAGVDRQSLEQPHLTQQSRRDRWHAIA